MSVLIGLNFKGDFYMSKQIKKVIGAVIVLSMLCCIFAGCSTIHSNGGTLSENLSNDNSPIASDKVFKIGICQLVQHDSLDAATNGFMAALKDKLGDNVEFNLQNAAGDSPTCSTIATQFALDGVDLIMANATPALQAAMSATADIPIVATSITDFATAIEADNWTGKTGINVTGTSDLMPIPTQALMFKELLPNVKNIGILYCSAEPNSKYQADAITAEFDKLGLNYKIYTVADTNEVASVVTLACLETDALYIPTDNTFVSATATVHEIASNAKTPIITSDEGSAAICAIATLSVSYYDIGYEAGLMAYEILVNDVDPAEMEIRYASNPTKKFIEANCNALNITVPSDYEKLVVSAKQ